MLNEPAIPLRARSAPTTGASRTAERGSIVISVSALMLIVLVTSGLVARGQFSIRTAADEADAAVAQATAEQGIAELLARLDTGERGDLSGTGRTLAGTYSYTATVVSDDQYQVALDGVVDGQTRSFDVTIGGGTSVAATPTLFIDSSASITNNAGTISGAVATNGTISASGTVVGDSVDLHGPSARCGNCGPATVHAETLDVPEPRLPSGELRRCPSDGVFTGVIDGRDGVPYVCNTSNVSNWRVEFVGTITVLNPPLQVYVETGRDIRFRNASVNASGAVDDFQLYALGDDDYWWMDSWNSKIRGVLYGPGRDSLLQYTSIEGSVAAGVLWISSPYQVWISPENGEVSTGDASGWTVTSFERVPSR